MSKVKICTKCLEEKSIKEFSKHTNTKDRLYPWCKQCYNEYQKTYRPKYDIENKDKLDVYRKEYRKEYRKNNPDYWKIWNENNPDFRKTYSQDWYQKNKERRKIYCKQPANFKPYIHQLTIEESSKEDENGYLLVKCTYCGKYFHPTNMEVNSRISGLLGRSTGENRLYCSAGCKTACPIYYQRKFPKAYKRASSREVDPII